MTRINTNVTSLLGQRVLGQNNQSLTQSLERLSTGLRINRGKDDPAGLIASENLRSEKTSIAAAIKNAERADQVVNIAEGGLNEISALLNELQGLVTTTANDAGLSSEEKDANQLQIDSILQTIDRVAGSTSFQGSKLLNGNLDYTTNNVNGQVQDFQVNGAKLNFGATRNVDVVVTGSAQTASYYLSAGADNLNLGGATATDGANEQFVIEIAGSLGARELSFASGTELTDVAAAINSFTDVTGVSATASGTGIILKSTEFGSDEFVSVKIVDDGSINGTNLGLYNFEADDNNTVNTTIASTFANLNNAATDKGKDVAAFINGVKATTDGTSARINTDFLDVEVDLKTGGSTPNAENLGAINAFTITGGGADFQLGGRVDIASKVSLGIGNVAAREIGLINDDGTNYKLSDLASGQTLSVVDGNLSLAQESVETAIREVASLRGRLGAFQQNTVGATIRSLGIALENTTAAESVVRDTDFASESASLTRSQILSQSSTQILTIANSQPQNALSLLG